MFVKEYDKDSGDITLVYNIGTDTNPNFVNATNTDAWNTVDSKDTVLMFVGSDDGEGLTGYTMDNITLANVFDADKWSDGQSHTTFTYNATNKRFEDGNAYLNEDFAPNVTYLLTTTPTIRSLFWLSTFRTTTSPSGNLNGSPLSLP